MDDRLKKAIIKLKATQFELENLKTQWNAPIAIIGMGCRFPGGANSPNAFWQLLSQGTDLISEIPKNRWDIDEYYDPDPNAPGKMYVRRGGFLNGDITAFDAGLFGISPREAQFMDPQQRLLLEVVWEALENAGINPLSLKETQTGVFIGVSTHDYYGMIEKMQLEDVDVYLSTGTSASVLSGRISYILGLQGPNQAIDTACSSSLVALDAACKSLQTGKSQLALAGGVNLMLNPKTTVSFSKGRMLSKDGCCKTFDAEADGYVRGEGCGVVVLKRLSDAMRDSDPILGVIKATEVNHDGVSSGLTVPNRESQATLINEALSDAGIKPQAVDYIEAHGTGTALGDPIEVGALGSVFAGRKDFPLRISSVKTNIGHLEAAAGIAGVIKTLLALNHEAIPPHLHFTKLNPHISLKEIPAEIPLQLTPWKRSRRPRIAGISSFGFSGTNAHVIIEEPPLIDQKKNTVDRPWHIMTLSAKTEAALKQLAALYKEHPLPNESIADIAFSANSGRAHFTHRIVILAQNKGELQDYLQNEKYLINNEAYPPPKVAFVFTGEPLETKELMETSPVFKEAMERNHGLAEYALFELWKSWGISPDYVIGAGAGDIIAALAAEVITLEEALKLIAAKDNIDELVKTAAEIRYREPQIGLISSWTGELIRKEGLTADYWKAHDAVKKIPEGSFVINSQGTWKELLDTLGQLYLKGAAIDWTGFDKPYHRKKVSLPIYPFQREKYWVEELRFANKRRLPKEAHPLLGEFTDLPNGEKLFKNEIDLDLLPYLKDHQVFESILFPGTGFTEMMQATGFKMFDGQPVTISNLVIEQALALSSRKAVPIQLIVQPKEGKFEASIYSGADQSWVLHTKGDLFITENLPKVKMEWEQLHNFCPTPVDIETLYGQLSAMGLHYGKEFQTLRKLWTGEREFIAELKGKAAAALADGSLQALASLVMQGSQDSDVYLPYSIDKVFCFSEMENSIRVHGRLIQKTDAGFTADIDIFSPEGKPLMKIEGFNSKKTNQNHLRQMLVKQSAQGITSWFYETCWEPKPLEQTEDEMKEPFLIVSQQDEQVKGVTAKTVKPKNAIEEITVHPPAAVLWFARGKGSLKDALTFVQALEKLESKPRLYFITHGIQPVGPIADLEHAAFDGFFKALRLEMPALDCRHIDLLPNEPFPVKELLAGDGEDQIAYRNGIRYVPRLLSARSAKRSGKKLLIPPASDFRLDTSVKGPLENLYLKPQDEPLIPGPQEIVVEVKAAALNFRDVLNAMGLYPGDPGPLGGECAGIVTATGEDVEEIKAGDRVAGFAPGCFGSRAIGKADLFAIIPPDFAMHEAAGIPIVFSTAFLALVELAKLKAGEKVLIHAAAGGVGLAAIQVAQSIGAEIYATASNPEKHAYLKSLGVSHIYNSRTLDFADEILCDTEGHGVDVVLNSLTGEGFISKTLTACSRGARFIEIAKRDIWSNETMREARPDIDYFILALDDLMAHQPNEADRILRTVFQHFTDNTFKPLHSTTFTLADTEKAFEYLQRAKNIGKVILTIPERKPLKIDPAGSYLITGGLGGLGLKTAEWLAGQGAKHLVLTGRNADKKVEIPDVDIQTVSTDVSQKEAVDALMQKFGSEWPELKGVIHAAGVLDDSVITSQSWERFEKVFAPKVQGSLNLHEASLNKPLDFFVLFSSIASSLGSVGQINYASANAFVDALANFRRDKGLPALSISWGPWAEVGMAAKLTQRHREGGLIAIKPQEGLKALGLAMEQNHPHISIANIDWKLISFQRAFFSAMTRAKPTPIPLLLERLTEALPSERRDILAGYLQRAVSKILGTNMLENDQGFFDAGMDSLMAIELKNNLQADIGEIYQFPPSLAFDYPSINKLAGYFEEHLFPLIDLKPKVQKAASVKISVETDQIAVVGMSCRFPKGADNPQLFWELLKQGYDGTQEIPQERWNIDAYYDPDPSAPGKMYVRRGGFLDVNIETFDAGFFGISPREAEFMDPQQRLLLEVAWEALENACINPLSLKGTKTGVFIGASTRDYYDMIEKLGLEDVGVYLSTGTAASVLSGRISYILGLQGPNQAIDTACSSSLVALHAACKSLQNGESTLALAGGINLMLNPDITISFSKGRMLSKDGYCKTFDAEADGYVRGEGCGVVILKRLSDAIRDNDHILGIIKAAEVNHDGSSSGLTVPNGESQAALINQALSDAKIEPQAVDYVEAHGTGTSLGDPIEVGALTTVFAGRKDRPLRIGSVKTNIGHLEAAAGIAGIIKTLLALDREAIPPHLHFNHLNPHISLDPIPAEIPLELTPWKRSSRPRIAGVSSFGFSGTNAHVIIEESPLLGYKQNPVDRPLHIITLSAKTEATLERLARLYKEQPLPQEAFADIAYSANSGRAHFSHRIAVVAQTKEEFEGCLQAENYLISAASPSPPKIAFIFTGELLDTTELMETSPVFRKAMERSQGLVDYALLELWKSWGVSPDYVIGEGTGDIVAALAAEVITLDEALKLIATKDNSDELAKTAAEIRYRAPQIGLISSWTGELIRKKGLTADYWKGHDAVKKIPEGSFVINSQGNWKELLDTLGQLYLKGGAIDWTGFDKPYHRKKVSLPTYPFQREKYWVEELRFANKRRLPKDAHPLLGEFTHLPKGEKLFKNEIDLDLLPYLKDHKVFDSILFPGAGFAEAMQAAGFKIFDGQPFTVHNLVIERPLALNLKKPLSMQFLAETNDGGYAASIYSMEGQSGILHAKGNLSISEILPTLKVDWDHLGNLCQNPVDIKELYYRLDALGFHYGQEFQTLQSIRTNEEEFIAELKGSATAALLDGSLQALASFSLQNGKTEEVYLPYSIDKLFCFAEPENSICVHGRLMQKSDAGFTADIEIFSTENKPLMKIEGFHARKTDQNHLRQMLVKQSSEETASWFYETCWEPKPLDQLEEGMKGPLLIVSQQDEHLEGVEAKTVKPENAIEQITVNPTTAVVWFARGKDSLKDALSFVQALGSLETKPRLYFITHGVQSIGPIADLEHAAFDGFFKALRLEMPALDCRHIDLSPNEAFPVKELLAADREDQTAYRDGIRYVPRLLPAASAKRSGKKLLAPIAEFFRLDISVKGHLENLYLKPQSKLPEPGPQEVTVEVEAAGINFLDVLTAMGLYPGDPGPLGGECAGIVTAIGKDVEEIKVGDRVAGFAPGCFGSQVSGLADLFALVPPNLSLNESAATPIVFSTAYLALTELAKLQAGEKVLIHAAAGGVGLAAIQIAQYAGAEIYATASTPEKHAHLMALGVSHIYNSRTLDFTEEILRDTGDKGIDVVLNSLTGKGFIAKTLSTCRQGARFVEIGKRDIWPKEQMRETRPDIDYFILALDDLMIQQPKEAGRILRTVFQHFSDNTFKPLHYTTFDLTNAEQAFEYLQRAKNIGKVILTIPKHKPLKIDPAGSYLITGGLGGLGLKTAEWLAGQGAKHLVLTGRKTDKQIEIPGATVEIVSADVSEKETVNALTGKFGNQWPELKGIVHAADVVDDSLLADQNWSRFEKVFKPKVQGSWNLHEASLQKPLDFFVLFSFAASSFGSQGLINYSAANAYMDALADFRQDKGLPALSINWGPWTEVGLAANLTERHRRGGIIAFKPEEGIKALELALSQQTSQLTIVNLDLKLLPSSSLLSELAPAKSSAIPVLLQNLTDALPSERKDILVSYLQRTLGKILGVSSLNPELGFFEAGMDSLMSEELYEKMQHDLGNFYKLPPTIAFDYPNTLKIVGYFEEHIFPLINLQGKTKNAVPARIVSETDQIAIIGMGCRFPKGADTPEKFWELLREGCDGIQEIPRKRWDIDEYYDPDPAAPGKMYVRQGGFLTADIETFDAGFFGISPREAQFMDPQQRLLLEVVWEALENACINPLSLKGTRTGVFVGCCSSEYSIMIEKAGLDGFDIYLSTGTAASVLSGRVSYILGLQGPNQTLDTACSSSLVALDAACKSLQTGKSHLALAGGVSLMLSPDITVGLSKWHMLSKDGYCKTFDAEADGYARGEGCGVVVLKPLSHALRDKDPILGVIKATEVNHDGASSGLTVPNGESQASLIHDALEDAKLEPQAVDYIEAHGTGTSLGDPIEVGALSAVFAGRKGHPLRIGSVKTNIGHLEAAAGIAGVIKTLLALNHEAIPPHLHFTKLNPHISLDAIPAEIPLELTPWKRSNRPRIAGISSFGFSGTNAHVIIQEPPLIEQKQSSVDRPWHIMTLSAKTEAALEHLVTLYKERPFRKESLADIAFTANSGRAHFTHRLAIVAQTEEELQDSLQKGNYLISHDASSPPKVAFVFAGEPLETKELLETSPVFKDAMERSHGLVEYALLELWKSWGISPDYVMGEGTGDIVAALAAEIITLEDALKLIAAKDNSDELVKTASAIRYREPQIGFISSWTGELVRKEGLTAEYWKAHDTVKKVPEDSFAITSQGNWNELLDLLKRLYLSGAAIDWTGFDKPYSRKKLALPTYPFQRERYWIDELRFAKKRRLSKEARPLLGEFIPSASGEKLFRSEIDLDLLPYLKDHQVFDNILFPVAGFIELMQAAGFKIFDGQAFSILHLVIAQPLALNLKKATPIQLPAQPKDGGYAASIYSGEGQNWILHAKADLSLSETLPALRMYWEQSRRLCQNPVNIKELYHQFDDLGLHYGKEFQTLQNVWTGQGEFIAELKGTAIAALIDGSLQALAALGLQDGQAAEFYLPYSINKLVCFSEPEDIIRAHGRVTQTSDQDLTADVEIFSPGGKPLAKIEGLHVRKTDQDHLKQMLMKQSAPVISSWFYEICWEPKPLDQFEEAKGPWLIVSEEEEQIEGLAAKTVKSEIATEETAVTPPAAVLWFAQGDESLKDALSYVQTLGKLKTKPRVYFITHGIQPIGPITDLDHAPFNGFFKTLKLEMPTLDCRHIDLAAGEAFPIKELSAADGEDQTAYRDGIRYVPRLLSARSAKRSGNKLLVPQAKDFRLDTSGKGLLENLYLKPQDEPLVPGPHEIVVKVKAAGLNFRDVLNAMGLYPGDAGPLGGECAGIVSAIGRDVVDFSVGDRVAGFSRGCFSSHAIGKADLFAIIPSDLAMPEAAGIPVVFSTACYALLDLAKLKPGEKVLIHAAAGGVGLAAVQIAQSLKAEIYATASTPEKHAYLRSLGVSHIYNSRTLDFADEILRDTEGHGVDVVLNSLTGEGFIAKSLNASSQGARFVEISKRDIWPKEDMAKERADIEYFILALDELMAEKPKEIGGLLRRVFHRFTDNNFSPLHSTLFNLTEAEHAFKYMQNAKNIGKVILTIPEQKHLTTDPNGSYLITGGLGGLGLKTAEWLAGQGAKHLVLTGQKADKKVEIPGAAVEVVSADVYEKEAVNALIEKFGSQWPELKGIVHAADVLDDGLLADQNWSRFEKVFKPKVQGSWNLHEASLQKPLDFFVLFSSIASSFGSPGQINHSAANAYMDALADFRKDKGLPALSINWGPWAEVDLTANLTEHHRREGIIAFKPEEGIKALELALSQQASQLTIVSLDLKRLPSRQLLSKLAPAQTSAEPVLLQSLTEAPPSKRKDVLVEYLQRSIGKISGLSFINPELNLFEAGMDSLMSVELYGKIQHDLGNLYKLPPTIVFDSPNIVKLTDYFEKHIFPIVDTKKPVSKEAAVSSLVVPIQTTGPYYPLFCIPGADGRALSFIGLARALGDNYPVYAIQANAFKDGKTPLPQNLTEIANQYVNAIRSIQKNGPYQLCAYSMGGVFAAEVAYQLESQGESINLLALLDTIETGHENPQFLALNPLVPILANINKDNIIKILNAISSKPFFDSDEILKTIYEHEKKILKNISYDEFKNYLYTMNNIIAAAKDYKSNHLKKVTQTCSFICNKGPYEEFGLKIKTNNLEIQSENKKEKFIIDCDHYEIIHAPHINTVANILKNHINKIEKI